MKESQIEIIKKVRAIENEMSKRRGLDRLVNYNSGEVVHKKQMEFHKCDKKNRWVFGGNRTGKTECSAVETVWLLRGIHPYKKNKPDVTGWVVSVSYEVQREVAQQKILSYLSPDWIQDVVMQQGRKDSLKNGVIDTIVVKNVFGGRIYFFQNSVYISYRDIRFRRFNSELFHICVFFREKFFILDYYRRNVFQRRY